MTASNDAAARSVMFSGLARSSWRRDVAIVAVWVSLIGGFIAHATTTPASATRASGQDTYAASATSAQPATVVAQSMK